MSHYQTLEAEVLVARIARALVDDPLTVEVESVRREGGTLLKLRVAPQDIGKVIGKEGRTARSLRTILAALSMKLDHHYTLDIVEDHSKSDRGDNRSD